MAKKKDIVRFHGKYYMAPSGCWEWVGLRDCFGYGVFSIANIINGLTWRNAPDGE